MRPAQLSFELPYDDFSGARVRVALCTEYSYQENAKEEVVEIQVADTVRLAPEDVEFVIDALIQIRGAMGR